ncbi:MAG: hypothetical protein AAFP03_04050 [Cyanobacteria bacterium J06598_3]
MAVLVKLQVSKKLLRFTPSDAGDFSRDQTPGGNNDGEFDITVTNTTNRFASFQVELQAETMGQTMGLGNTANGAAGQPARWYKVEPEVGAKQPPGDRTTFHITLLKAPIPAYDSQINLQVKAFSVEVDDIEAVETVQLQIGRPKKSLRAYLPFQELTVYPGDRIKVPALVYNLSAEFAQITLRLRGIHPEWIQNGQQRTVQIESGGFSEELFWCHPPPSAKSLHHTYDLILEAVDHRHNTASDVAHLQVLPFGQVKMICDQPEQKISPLRSQPVTYPLQLTSESNLTNQVHIDATAASEVALTLPEDVVLAPEADATIEVVATAKPPWVGRTRRRLIEVTPSLFNPQSGEPNPQIATQPASQLLSLEIRPILPLWLQIGSGLLLLLLTALLWWFMPPKPRHASDVNSIRLIANEETVVSASSDQTIRRWQVNDQWWIPSLRRLRYKGIIASGTQGIRVVHQLPAEVAQVAAGLENGDIQFWPVSPSQEQPIATLPGNNDRVFDLVFTGDSKSLFSAHGSGAVKQWTQSAPNQWKPGTTLSGQQSGALSAIAVSEAVGEPTLVTIAGQYNQLTLWNPADNIAYKIKYAIANELAGSFPAVVSQNSYITDLAIAQRPNQPESARLVTADNQGFITLWNLNQMRSCLKATPESTSSTSNAIAVECTTAIIDQWQENSTGLAVRSVALSTDACYLASTGDRGQVRLWPLGLGGSRNGKALTIETFTNERLNSVTLQKASQQGSQNLVLIASDAPGYRVRLYRQEVTSNGCQ